MHMGGRDDRHGIHTFIPALANDEIVAMKQVSGGLWTARHKYTLSGNREFWD